MNERRLSTRAVDKKSTEIKQHALTLIKGPMGWMARALEAPQNRERRRRLQGKLIKKGVEVQTLAAEDAVKSCRLQTEFEYQQARDRELIHHRNEVTKLEIQGQEELVEQLTSMVEHKQDALKQIDQLDVDPSLSELAKRAIGETCMNSAQNLIDRHDE